jgi:hypothetical protein
MTIPFLPSLMYWVLMHFIALKRRPDQIIGRNGDAYLLRWFVFGGVPNPEWDGINEYERTLPRRPFGLTFYFHCFLRSDYDELHDHPWDWMSLIFRGACWEHFFRDPAEYDWEKDFGEDASTGAIAVQRGPYYDSPYQLKKAWGPGSLRFGRADMAHRVELFPAGYDPANLIDATWLVGREFMQWSTNGYAKVWSLFITGKWQRKWGFWCDGGTRWVHNKDFNEKGCGP